MKRILFSTLALILYIGMANAQGERFVGTWLATDGNKSYQIIFTLGKETTKYNDEMVTATVLYGTISYLNKGEVVRRVKSSVEKKTLIAVTLLSNSKIVARDTINIYFNDKERNAHGSFTAIISADNNTLSWKYNVGSWEGTHYLRKGETVSQPLDLPHDLTFKRISN